jgi:ankyrin repeat protein
LKVNWVQKGEVIVVRHIFVASFLILIFGLAPVVAAPLHEAVTNGDIEGAAQLIQRGAALEEVDEDGETPLTAAALAGESVIVELLIEHGAQVNGRNAGGFTALHAAAYNGHITIVEVLLDHDADINDQDNKAKIAPLHAAAEKDHLKVAELLIDRGARLDLKELNGWTPLARATFKRYGEMVVLLRQHGGVCPSSTAVGDGHSGFCQNPGS